MPQDKGSVDVSMVLSKSNWYRVDKDTARHASPTEHVTQVQNHSSGEGQIVGGSFGIENKRIVTL